MTSGRWFVYLDWTLEGTPRCFYVGKGNEARVRKRTRNELWKQIDMMCGSQREIVYETTDELAAYAYEETLIAHYETYEGWGANLTPGGNAVMSGRNHTPETKEKCRLGSLGNKNSLGRKAGPETIAKISGPNHHFFGKKQSEEHIEKNRLANHGEKNAQAKLTWEKVRDIRTCYALGGYSHKSLAHKHGVTKTLVGYIIRGKLWKEHNK